MHAHELHAGGRPSRRCWSASSPWARRRGHAGRPRARRRCRDRALDHRVRRGVAAGGDRRAGRRRLGAGRGRRRLHDQPADAPVLGVARAAPRQRAAAPPARRAYLLTDQAYAVSIARWTGRRASTERRRARTTSARACAVGRLAAQHHRRRARGRGGARRRAARLRRAARVPRAARARARDRRRRGHGRRGRWGGAAVAAAEMGAGPLSSSSAP